MHRTEGHNKAEDIIDPDDQTLAIVIFMHHPFICMMDREGTGHTQLGRWYTQEPLTYT